ncbi:unannotated protein [freshwater metagenome]|uniref:Unannotated protein n=1 Tax=freshwater metagenome TaxID=449393 RepID=A0A6J7XV84_9ZZZZ|nr:hypothetical protein [Actinomycetota bacterium]
MYIAQISALVNFLASKPNNYDEIARFLTLHFPTELSASATYIVQLNKNGKLIQIGVFGIDQSKDSKYLEMDIHTATPLTSSLRNNDVEICHNTKKLYDEFPFIHPDDEPKHWQSHIAIPMHSFGGVGVLLETTIEKNDELLEFFRCIGVILACFISEMAGGNKPAESISISKSDEDEETLTQRQQVIVEMIKKGFNNAEIAKELSFSESLVRQENVAIYRKLGIAGRKVLIDSQQNI